MIVLDILESWDMWDKTSLFKTLSKFAIYPASLLPTKYHVSPQPLIIIVTILKHLYKSPKHSLEDSTFLFRITDLPLKALLTKR